MQRGIASAFILILIAVVIGLTALGVGYYTFQSAVPKKGTVSLPPEYLIPVQTAPVFGSPECPDIDYTGCDTSSDFMIWDESDIQINNSSQSTILVK